MNNYLKKNFSKKINDYKIPSLLAIQLDPYNNFFQINQKIFNLKDYGLNNLIKSKFPIIINNYIIDYVCYRLKKNNFNYEESIKLGLTMSYFIFIKFRIMIKNLLNNIYKTKEEEIYFCTIPIMNKKGTFIINGIEKTIISQLYKTPGLFINFKFVKKYAKKNRIFYAQIVPLIGSWLTIEFNNKNNIVFKIDNNRKLYITTLFKALGFSNEYILSFFYDLNIIYINNNVLFIKLNIFNFINKSLGFHIYDNNNNIIIDKYKIINLNDIYLIKSLNKDIFIIPELFLINKILAENIIYKNKIIYSTNSKITKNLIWFVKKIKLNRILILDISCFKNNKDMNYISNTLIFDKIKSQKEACLIIKNKLKYMNNKNTYINIVNNIFFNHKNYNLSDIGRINFNHKLRIFKIKTSNFKISNNNIIINTLLKDDIFNVVKILIKTKNKYGLIDDIDNLINKKIKTTIDFIYNDINDALNKLKILIKNKILKEKNKYFKYKSFFSKKKKNKKIKKKFSLKKIFIMNNLSSIIKDFFIFSELSQFLDQTNILSELAHKRKISLLGPGGMKKQQANFNSRDVNITYYGKICPIESPEGPNIGLINSFAIYSIIDNNQYIRTPYIKIINCKLSNIICYLSSEDEENNYIAHSLILKKKKIKKNIIACRFSENIVLSHKKYIKYMDVAPNQIISISVSLIPFIEHNDASRVLMGANMQKQSLSPIKLEPPLISTGFEKIIAFKSRSIVKAIRSGIVTYIDNKYIIINCEKKNTIDIYKLIKYIRSNQNTNINQKPIIKINDYIYKNQIIADSNSTKNGELSLGQNMITAFMMWNGYNYEDSIIVSKKVLIEDRFTTLHKEEFNLLISENLYGVEKILKEIPGIDSNKTKYLNNNGIIKIGTWVKGGDILIGKITPKEPFSSLPEEKLLNVILKINNLNIKESSLRAPIGINGVVINIKIFNKNKYDNIDDVKFIKKINIELLKYKKKILYEFNILENIILNKIFKILIKNKKNYLVKNNIQNLKNIIYDKFKYEKLIFLLNNNNIKNIINIYKNSLKENKNYYKRKLINRKEILLKKIDIMEFFPNVKKKIKIFIMSRKNIKVGDKMSGRHGNKGVISKILEINDMPYMQNGDNIDLLINPLGVPSRMNIGQVLEIHLGLALKGLGNKIKIILKEKNNYYKLRIFLNKIYNKSNKKININSYNNSEIICIANKLINGIPLITPPFDSVKETEINYWLNLAFPNYLNKKLKFTKNKNQFYIKNGITGEIFYEPITIGCVYYLKLYHLVTNKIHARSIGPYSLITQQPLKGRSNLGGQRLGEMEVWALEAYGVAYILKEMLTIKSDDIKGRNIAYNNLIKGKYVISKFSDNFPESFNVLINKIKSLGISIYFKNNEK